MRPAIAIGWFIVLGSVAGAACPPGMIGGGGPAATDCFIEFGGIPSTKASCVDGDPSCDLDGAADGTCTFNLQVAVNVAGAPGCSPGTLQGPPSVSPTKTAAEQALATALRTLSLAGQDCTPPGFAVPLRPGLAGLKPGIDRFAVSAVSGNKRDRDKLKLTCTPGRPATLAQVQPIFTAKCAIPTCHQGINPPPQPGGLNLEDGKTFASTVGQPSTNAASVTHGLKRVEPGSIKKSYLARKVLGVGLVRAADDAMPQGCPVLVPCLTPSEVYEILSWIQGGAPQ